MRCLVLSSINSEEGRIMQPWRLKWTIIKVNFFLIEVELTSRMDSYKSNPDSSDEKISDAGEAIEAVQ